MEQNWNCSSRCNTNSKLNQIRISLNKVLVPLLNLFVILPLLGVTCQSHNSDLTKYSYSVSSLSSSNDDDSLYSSQYQIVPIGGLFDNRNVDSEAVFKNAINRVNGDPSTLPRSKFIAQIEHLDPGNTVSAGTQVCNMMSKGVAAIFGPQSHESASHVQSICDAFEIPHIETKWDFRIRKENYLINLYPHPSTLSRAYNDLVEAFNWESYVIIYDNEEGLFKLQDLIKASIPTKRHALLRQLPPGNDYRSLFREILRETKMTNIIIDCEKDKIHEVLKQAQQIGLMTFQYSYILTTLDLHTIDLLDFRFAEVNITAFRMVDPERPEVQSVLQQFTQQSKSYLSGHTTQWMPEQEMPELHTYMISTETALLYDAVYLLARALHVLDSSQRIDIKRLNCSETDTWQHGYSIINYMKMVQLQGLTGLIQFNTTGFRTDVQLDVIQLKDQLGLKKIGSWDSKFISKFNWSRPVPSYSRDEYDALDIKNRTFIVSTILNNPFTMLARSEQPLLGNARYEGFVVDLLKKLSQILGFKYIVKPVNDGNYGGRNRATGVWNGMMREVLDGVADIAVADLTINKERQEAVDFTMPFMNLGISILYVVPSAKPPSLFSFLLPFSRDVWIYMLVAFCGVSIVLYVLARLTPYEWDNPHPCITDPDELVNQFTALNCFWFTIGSLMQQGSDLAPKISPYEWSVAYPCKQETVGEPVVYTNDVTLANSLWITLASLLKQKTDVPLKAVSTRMIAGIWWFFTLIMVSSYTANLATFLIVQDLDETIKNLADLANQDTVKYGCVGSGSTVSFFRDSPFELNQKIWTNIVKNEKKFKVLMNNNNEGIEKVKASKGKYAFFMESTVIEYTIERECQLAQTGGLLDSKGYGIALPKGSKYLQPFSSGILRLQEAGVLDDLKRKWWKEERKDSVCASGSDDSVKPLKLANVGGVFVVLVFGSLFAILLSFLEFLWKSRELARNHGENYWDGLKGELKFALLCRGNTKPVKKNKSKSGSLSNTDIALAHNVGHHGLGHGHGHGHLHGHVPGSGSNAYLDLTVDAYGFPITQLNSPINGGLDRDGFT